VGLGCRCRRGLHEVDSPRGQRRARSLFAALIGAVSLLAALAAPASADFPYTGANGDPRDYTDLYLDQGEVPNDEGSQGFKLKATPDPRNGPQINQNPVELFGVRGAHVVDPDPSVSTAYTQTTGRPDVTIAILDSGIKWDDAGAMLDLRFKNRLNAAELPTPQNTITGQPNEPGENCSTYTGAGDDINGDGVFNLRDYACDSRVNPDPALGVGPDFPAGGPNAGQPMLDPQDLLIRFSDGTDEDNGGVGNGYVDDIVGWDFVDDDNDPYDDVQYGHGTGEARDSTAEANNGNGTELGTCPNCMGVYLRVGDSFIADVNRFGAAVTYATDNDVQVVQEALGTLNNSSLARQAVNYAYRHGVTVMASAADEAAQHNNWPSTLPHVILVNSVRDNPLPTPNKSYLAFNGCTNFNAKITLAIPSTSCSSNAVGNAAGFAGLIYSAALNAHDKGQLPDYPDQSACKTTDGQPCVITPNEVRQLMASGTVDGELTSDDVDFAGVPGDPEPPQGEPSCVPIPTPECTSPYGTAEAIRAAVNATRPSYTGSVVAESYPARFGHDQFYGYGRANLDKGTAALYDPATPTRPAKVPPEAEIFSPEWFQPIDPTAASISVEGEVFARGADYRCRVLVAPGQYPNQHEAGDTPPGDFKPISTPGYCDGSLRAGADAQKLHKGTLAQINVAALKAQFPRGTNFTGSIPPATPVTGNGRPFFAPQAFTFKVVVTTTGANPMTGEDQRSSYLHRDADLLPGFPKAIKGGGQISAGAPTGDGESSPAFADLDGDNRNEMIFGSSDGFVHALRPNGAELPGFPVRGDQPGFVTRHAASKAYASGAVSQNLGGAILSSVAVGDPDHDGVPTIYALDFEGKAYGWSPAGKRVFTQESNIKFSGKPLAPFVNVRKGPTNRTQHGFFASPVLADLDGDGKEELIAASMDRHLYAWEAADSSPNAPGGAARVPGYPLLVVDPKKVASVAPVTHAITFRADAKALQQGAIIDTPALADLAGDDRPEIVVGTNEEYTEPINANNPSFGALGQAGVLSVGNSRLYALRPEGGRDANPLPSDAILPGWPFRLGIALTELLPVVGEGVTGYPIVAKLTCPFGGSGPKIGALANNGPAYVINADGTSCYGEVGGRANALESDFAAGIGEVDRPVLPAVGHPAFGALGGGQPAFLTPAAGVTRALDLAFPEYQPTGQDFLGAWDTTTGRFRPGYPAAVNDLQFLTGPSIADIDGLPGQETIEGTASQDLAAFNAAGAPVSNRWPKLSTDWTVTNPLIGSFGTQDTDAGSRKVVAAMTRSGLINAYRTTAPACSPASWPRFHHDNANSGDYSRDALLPGKPTQVTTNQARDRIRFTAPGDDLLCGVAKRYAIVTSDSPIDEGSFAQATRLQGASSGPGDPGSAESLAVPPGAKRYVAIRAVDEQGNVGRLVSVRVTPQPPAPDPGAACANRLSGTGGDDRLRGTNGGDRIAGRGGDDRISGRGGVDCVAGGSGKDHLAGNAGSDRIKGGSGGDELRGAGGSDRLVGGSGGERIFGGAGDDRVQGGGGRDFVSSGDGDDRIDVRGGGRDRVTCGAGKDRVLVDRRDHASRRCERIRRG